MEIELPNVHAYPFDFKKFPAFDVKNDNEVIFDNLYIKLEFEFSICKIPKKLRFVIK